MVLLGGGTAIGVAMTGGASAAAGNSPGSGTTTASSGTAASTAGQTDAANATAAGRCAKITGALRQSGHDRAAWRLTVLCHSRLLRLALVGGEHGVVTFKSMTGTTTMAFERGTLEAVSSSEVTVKAADGTTWTWDLTSATVVRSDRQQVAASALTSGEQVLVGGPVSGGAHDARIIRIRPAR